ncbi:MAG: hypothetical protein KKE62_09030 [Proteobacteria bacterium]|nr:hypothetical protein [Pseudomonadota bacterium]MBU1386283.1 hypothetical protein [Pseudomonadota bacterium]MBU1542975.1 hypothetical protein [Pseudomonadota bacterium]MBU2431328.1 hypothetical protein [Pseudomonadota bacterium]MBU2479998.1 hypothetical protein [Pseudomonadota bacterium]
MKPHRRLPTRPSICWLKTGGLKDLEMTRYGEMAENHFKPYGFFESQTAEPGTNARFY